MSEAGERAATTRAYGVLGCAIATMFAGLALVLSGTSGSSFSIWGWVGAILLFGGAGVMIYSTRLVDLAGKPAWERALKAEQQRRANEHIEWITNSMNRTLMERQRRMRLATLALFPFLVAAFVGVSFTAHGPLGPYGYLAFLAILLPFAFTLTFSSAKYTVGVPSRVGFERGGFHLEYPGKSDPSLAWRREFVKWDELQGVKPDSGASPTGITLYFGKHAQYWLASLDTAIVDRIRGGWNHRHEGMEPLPER